VLLIEQHVCVAANHTNVLIEKLLGEPLADYVKRHRDDERTWAWIARDLEARVGVRYSREWVRRLSIGSDRERAA